MTSFRNLLGVRDALIKALLVIPAKAGIQCLEAVAEALDPSFRWDDDLFRSSLAPMRKHPVLWMGLTCLLACTPAFACKPLAPDARRDGRLDASTADMAFIGTVTSVKASRDNPIAQGGDFIVNRYLVSVRRVSILKGQAPTNLDFEAYTGCGISVPDMDERVVVFSSGGTIRAHDAGEHYEQYFRAALKGKR